MTCTLFSLTVTDLWERRHRGRRQPSPRLRHSRLLLPPALQMSLSLLWLVVPLRPCLCWLPEAVPHQCGVSPLLFCLSTWDCPLTSAGKVRHSMNVFIAHYSELDTIVECNCFCWMYLWSPLLSLSLSLLRKCCEYFQQFGSCLPTLTCAHSLAKLLVAVCKTCKADQHQKSISDCLGGLVKRPWRVAESTQIRNEALEYLLKYYFGWSSDPMALIELVVGDAVTELMGEEASDSSRTYPTLTEWGKEREGGSERERVGIR